MGVKHNPVPAEVIRPSSALHMPPPSNLGKSRLVVAPLEPQPISVSPDMKAVLEKLGQQHVTVVAENRTDLGTLRVRMPTGQVQEFIGNRAQRRRMIRNNHLVTA